MNHSRILILVLAGLFLLGGCSADLHYSSSSSGEKEPVSGLLVQVGTLQGLVAGEYDGTASLRELYVGHSSFIGLGTFDALDGELVMIGGVCYRVGVDGQVTVMKPTDTTPFANVADMSNHLYCNGLLESQSRNYAELKEDLLAKLRKIEKIEDGAAPTRPYAFVITGEFASVKTRSVPRQSKPYRKLIDVVKTGQVVFNIDYDPKGIFDVAGTIVGFYYPPSFKGVNITGFHMHFLTADRSAGGHMLDFDFRGGPTGGNWIGGGETLSVEIQPLKKKIYWVGKVGEVREASHDDLKTIEQGK